MSVVVKNNFLSVEQSREIIEILHAQVKQTPRDGIKSALGWESVDAAARIGFESRSPMDNSESLVTDTFRAVISDMREHFGVEDMVLVNGFYTVMGVGSKLDLHCDNINLDGSPLDPEVEVEPNQWSAVLYLNSSGDDYEGGDIEFPVQEVRIAPTVGDLVYFKTDIEHPHLVHEVTSGDRICLVFFMGSKEIISSLPTSSFSGR